MDVLWGSNSSNTILSLQASSNDKIMLANRIQFDGYILSKFDPVYTDVEHDAILVGGDSFHVLLEWDPSS